MIPQSLGQSRQANGIYPGFVKQSIRLFGTVQASCQFLSLAADFRISLHGTQQQMKPLTLDGTNTRWEGLDFRRCSGVRPVLKGRYE